MGNDFFSELVSFASRVMDLEFALTQAADTGVLPPVQQKILRILFFDDAPTMSRLSECAGISLPNCSREVRQLVAHGLVVKVPSKTDKRAVGLRLSEAGHRAVADTFVRMKEAFYRQGGPWTPERESRVREGMQILDEQLFGKLS